MDLGCAPQLGRVHRHRLEVLPGAQGNAALVVGVVRDEQTRRLERAPVGWTDSGRVDRRVGAAPILPRDQIVQPGEGRRRGSLLT